MSEPAFLSTLRQTLGPETTKALLVWFAAEGQTLEATDARLNAILGEVQDVDPAAAYAKVESLSLEDRVRFMLLKEFGPIFRDKRHFDALTKAITARLQSKQVG